MFSITTVIKIITSYIKSGYGYGEEVEASMKGAHFYNDQIYRDEDGYYSSGSGSNSSNEIDLELGISSNNEPSQVVSYY